MPDPRKSHATLKPRQNKRADRLSVTLTLGLNDPLLRGTTLRPTSRRRIRSRRTLLTAICTVLFLGVLLALLRELFF